MLMTNITCNPFAVLLFVCLRLFVSHNICTKEYWWSFQRYNTTLVKYKKTSNPRGDCRILNIELHLMMENYYKYLLTNVSLNSFPKTHQKKIASTNFLLYVDNAWTVNNSRKPDYIFVLHLKPWSVFYKHKNNNNNNNNLNDIWVKICIPKGWTVTLICYGTLFLMVSYSA